MGGAESVPYGVEVVVVGFCRCPFGVLAGLVGGLQIAVIECCVELHFIVLVSVKLHLVEHSVPLRCRLSLHLVEIPCVHLPHIRTCPSATDVGYAHSDSYFLSCRGVERHVGTSLLSGVKLAFLARLGLSVLPGAETCSRGVSLCVEVHSICLTFVPASPHAGIALQLGRRQYAYFRAYDLLRLAHLQSEAAAHVEQYSGVGRCGEGIFVQRSPVKSRQPCRRAVACELHTVFAH